MENMKATQIPSSFEHGRSTDPKVRVLREVWVAAGRLVAGREEEGAVACVVLQS